VSAVSSSIAHTKRSRTTVAWRNLVLALLAVALNRQAAVADQTDTRLDGLFAQLETAESAGAAHPIEAQIWGIWMQSGVDRIDSLMKIGVTALNATDYNGAVEAFSRVVALAPNFAEGWNKRATALYLMGRTTESMQDIDRVMALEPRHFGALSGLGLCNARLGKDQAALEAFERAAAVDPRADGIRMNIEETKKRLARHSI
jgi:tetratricopeptide (TPR) repeat protein